MAETKRVIEVDEFQHRLLANGLNEFRSKLIEEGEPTEDVNELLLQVIDAPTKKEKRKLEREGR